MSFLRVRANLFRVGSLFFLLTSYFGRIQWSLVPIPGVWEVPLVHWQDFDGNRCAMGDGCRYPQDSTIVKDILMLNFDRHYKSNRWVFVFIGSFYVKPSWGWTELLIMQSAVSAVFPRHLAWSIARLQRRIHEFLGWNPEKRWRLVCYYLASASVDQWPHTNQQTRWIHSISMQLSGKALCTIFGSVVWFVTLLCYRRGQNGVLLQGPKYVKLNWTLKKGFFIFVGLVRKEAIIRGPAKLELLTLTWIRILERDC